VYKQLYHHEVAMLDDDAARRLFRQAAGLDQVPEGLAEVEAAVLEACGGLPLALTCAGGQLCDSKDLELWQVMLATHERTWHLPCCACVNYLVVAAIMDCRTRASCFTIILASTITYLLTMKMTGHLAVTRD
jgi:hypothetical protein